MQVLRKLHSRGRQLASTLRREMREYLKNAPRIFFCHVPKCAGGSISAAIYDSYSIRERLFTSMFRINLRASDMAYKICSKDMMEVREVVLCYNLSLPTYTFGAGHCRCRPQLVQSYKDSWNFVTILRDPVVRWISEYVYNTYTDKTVPGRGNNELPLKDYIVSKKGKRSGIYFLRYFSSMPVGYDGDVEEFVNEAIANLRQFRVVGTIERIEFWRQTFRQVFKRDITIPKVNTSPKPGIAEEISSNEALISQIRQLCEPDIRIYQNIVEQVGAAG